MQQNAGASALRDPNQDLLWDRPCANRRHQAARSSERRLRCVVVFLAALRQAKCLTAS